MYWEAIKLTMTDSSFPEFLFSLESLNFIFGNKIYSHLLSLKRHLFMFKKTSTPNPILNNHICLSVAISSKKKWILFTSYAQLKQLHKSFFLIYTIIPTRSALCILPISSDKRLKDMYSRTVI